MRIQKPVALVAVDVGHHRGQAVGDQAQAPQAVVGSLFVGLAFGHILEGAKQAHHLAVLDHRLALRAHRECAALGRDERQLEVPGRAVGHAGLHRRLNQRPRFGGVEIEGRQQPGLDRAVDLVDAVDLVGPAQVPGREFKLPTAHPGDRAHALKQAAGMLQRPPVVDAGSHVGVRANDAQWHTERVARHHDGMVPHPDPMAVAVANAVLARVGGGVASEVAGYHRV